MVPHLRSLPNRTAAWAALALLAAASILAPSEIDADPDVIDVALLHWRPSTSGAIVAEGFRAGLSRTGLTASVDEKDCRGDIATARDLLATWREEGMDVYVAEGLEALDFLAKHVTDRPVVFAVSCPATVPGAGHDPSPARGNVTGVCLRPDIGHILRFYRKAIPGLNRLGVLYGRDLPGSVREVEAAVAVLSRTGDARETSGLRGLDLVPRGVNRSDGEAGVLEALRFLTDRGVQAVWVPDDPFILDHLDPLARLANERHLPLLGTHPHGSRRELTAAIAPHFRNLGVHAAARVARIVRDGVPPDRLPTGEVRRALVVLNLKAAQRAGVSLPLEALVDADVIIDRDGW